MAFIDNEFYTPVALSEGLGGKPGTHTLAKMRGSARGPRFTKAGRTVLYRGADVNAWLLANTFAHTNQSASPVRVSDTEATEQSSIIERKPRPPANRKLRRLKSTLTRSHKDDLTDR